MAEPCREKYTKRCVTAREVSSLDMSASFQRVLCTGLELGPEDVSLLERCPHFRGCYVQASVELGSVSSFQRHGVRTRRCVPIREVSSFQGVLCSLTSEQPALTSHRLLQWSSWSLSASDSQRYIYMYIYIHIKLRNFSAVGV